MGWILISFIAGLILGGCIGFVALALCVSARQADKVANKIKDYDYLLIYDADKASTFKIKSSITKPPRRLSGVQDRQRYRGSCPIANG